MTKVKKTLKISLIVFLCLLLIISCVIFSYVYNINKQLSYNSENLIYANSKVDIYDDSNSPLTNYSEQVSNVSLSELPSYVPASFISIEDKNFYNHNGLNYKRMAKALLKNIKSMRAKEGASTITQQLVKNTYLSSDKTIERKVKEILLTKKVEKEFSKQEILENYLNLIYFGNGSYGINEASKNYFNKNAKDLSISESALLAGIIKSPKLYSPIFNKENALKRRNLVLSEMLKDGSITNEEYNIAVNEDIDLKLSTSEKLKNWYYEATLQEASEKLNLSEKDIAKSGYKIFTYYNEKDEDSLKNAINNETHYHINSHGNIADSCGIIIDNKTGGITAFTGKSAYDIINMKRSPGSTIKPILVYAPALENGVISPSTPILDEKTTFGDYSPSNVGNIFYGYVSARKTLEKSLNIPAIKIMKCTGLNKCKKMAEDSGITFDKTDNNYAIALGALTNGITVKQLVNSYLPIANNGKFVSASFIRKICDNNGNLVYENNQNEKQVISEETAFLLTDMLKSSTKYGTSARLKDLPFEIAGKTGTVGVKNTNLNTDVWSVAYTTEKTCGIWLGNSTNEKEYMLEGSNNGGTYCTSMVKEVFENIYKNNSPKNFEKPQNVIEIKIDSLELENNHVLKIADETSPEIFTEKALFNKKYVPKEIGSSFNELSVVKLKVNLSDNKPKISFNALSQCEYKIFRIEEDTTRLLKTIKNKKGQVEFIDDDILLDTQYEYFVEAVAVNHATNYTSKKIKSNSVKIFTPSILTNNTDMILNRNFAFA